MPAASLARGRASAWRERSLVRAERLIGDMTSGAPAPVSSGKTKSGGNRPHTRESVARSEARVSDPRAIQPWRDHTSLMARAQSRLAGASLLVPMVANIATRIRSSRSEHQYDRYVMKNGEFMKATRSITYGRWKRGWPKFWWREAGPKGHIPSTKLALARGSQRRGRDGHEDGHFTDEQRDEMITFVKRACGANSGLRRYLESDAARKKQPKMQTRPKRIEWTWPRYAPRQRNDEGRRTWGPEDLRA
jgi:hypothetical protein